MLGRFIVNLPLKDIFQRVPGLWLLCVLPFGFFGPIYLPLSFAAYYLVLHILFFINNARSAYGMYVAYKSARLFSVTDWLKKYCEQTGTQNGSDPRHDMPYDSINHVIILPNYKEDMDTLCETLDVLASHRRALTQYRICLAMEESEQGSVEKAESLIKLYSDSFFDITYSVHPVGIPGEIRGKSSNVAWAASEMARRYSGGIPGRHSHEILTVMDADTCFAEDYFNSVGYYYCIASPEQRRIMMFAPSTVFDRNSNSVPVFVRVTDMFWSIGVISNLYTSSPIKLPCSAYSVSMDLAIAVNFWDSGPEAIGEDMHMYLKCFFLTDGRVICRSIFSPASQCNITGEGTGWSGYMNGIGARYTQAVRHLWGSLDSGYVLRKTLMGIFAPEVEPSIILKNAPVDKIGKREQASFPYQPWTIFSLFHRMLESHIIMGHLFILITISTVIFPVKSSYSYEFAAWVWSFLTSDPVHPYVTAALHLAFWVRFCCLFPNLLMIMFYEKYHQWVGYERWQLSKANNAVINDGRSDSGIFTQDYIEKLPTIPSGKVQYLGRRPQLCSLRTYPRNLFDWIAIPISGFLFYVLPQFHAQITHLFTDRLDYKVAAKPQLHRPAPLEKVTDATPMMNDDFLSIKKREEYDVKSILSATSSKADEGYFEEDELSHRSVVIV